MKYLSGLLLLLTLIMAGFWSCRDDGFDSSPHLRLSFSQDSLLFDTVFTTKGSSTRTFRVYNTHNRRIRLNDIMLAGGAQSFYRMNVDGRSGTMLKDVTIEPNDSIFVFVEVTIDPVNQSLPLTIVDSILFNINGHIQDVKLVAWGQDAHFIHPNYTDPNTGLSFHIIDENTTWTSGLPYVVYGIAAVAPGVTLRIEEGSNIHFHNNSSLIFLQQSSLKVDGSLENPVTFQGDRLETFYREQPGQWGRIWFTATSRDHEIDYAIIKNGTVGLHVDTLGSYTDPTLRIRNTVIKNMSLAGLLAQGSHVEAENLAIANCGEHAMILALGGNYDFRHLTIANYFSIKARNTPSVFINNYYEDIDGQIQQRDFVNLYFANSIIYGSNQEELGFDLLEGTESGFIFDHCLIRTRMDLSLPGFKEVISQDPLFHNNAVHDFRLTDNSPAIGKGDPDIAIAIPFDLQGLDRTHRPDLGALQYTHIEEEK